MNIESVVGLILGVVAFPVGWWLMERVSIDVPEGHAVEVTSFGKWMETLQRPGHHWFFSKIFPWVKTHVVSKQIQSQLYSHIPIHDRDGTSLMVEIWMQFQVTDSKRVLFAVEDWKQSMKTAVLNSVSSCLGGDSFREILTNRDALDRDLRLELKPDLARWGVEIHRVAIRNIEVLPEVSRQILQGVAAHLERKKAVIEEEAKMQGQRIQAEAQLKIANLKAEASVQLALEIGKAYQALKRDPEVFMAYERLYGLSLYREESVLLFEGFGESLRTNDALFLAGAQGLSGKSADMMQSV